MKPSFAGLIERARAQKRKIAAVCAHDEDLLLSLAKASAEGIVDPILLGEEAKIRELIETLGIGDMKAEIIDVAGDAATAEAAVRMVSGGEAQMLMKGKIATSTFLKAVLNKDWGLRRGNGLLSHVGITEFEGRFLFVTDAAINIEPNLDEKKKIIENAVYVARRMGVELPKVAALAAVEVVNPKMPPTIDAALLAKMADRGQIKHCLVDGPLAIDNAVNPTAAKIKKVTGPVAGQADILMVPHINAGNVLYKTLSMFGKKPMAGLVVGVTAPIVLVSRTDTDESKFNAILCAAAVALGGEK